MIEPTKRQLEILFFIAGYITEKERPPTLRDISGHFEFTVKSASDATNYLVLKQMITKSPDQSSRSILITDEGWATLRKHGLTSGQIYRRILEFQPCGPA